MAGLVAGKDLPKLQSKLIISKNIPHSPPAPCQLRLQAKSCWSSQPETMENLQPSRLSPRQIDDARTHFGYRTPVPQIGNHVRRVNDVRRANNGLSALDLSHGFCRCWQIVNFAAAIESYGGSSSCISALTTSYNLLLLTEFLLPLMTTHVPQTLPLDAALRQAVTHHQAGQLPEAERLYRAILHAQPDQPHANHNLGVLAIQVGKHATGFPYLRAALALDSSHEQYRLSDTEALLATGQAIEALRIHQTAKQRGLNTPAARAL